MKENNVNLVLQDYYFKPKVPSILKSLKYAYTFRLKSDKYSFLTLFNGRRDGKLFVPWIKDTECDFNNLFIKRKGDSNDG